MNFRGLSDADIEALVGGEPVAGAPAQLSELVGALRGEFDVTPIVEVGTALGEFIDVIDVTTPTVASTSSHGVGLGAKAAAAFGAVSVKVLLGAAVAAASVGGAHVLDVVDVPGLPNKATTVPVEAPEPVPDDSGEIPALVEKPEIPPADQPAPSEETPESEGPMVEATVPAENGAEPGEGCEFGQETAETRSGDAIEERGDAGPPIDPCEIDQTPGDVRPDPDRGGPQGLPEDLPSGPPENTSTGRTPRGS